jgi:ABC-type phosphate transport system substrate-binding protein
MRRHRIAGAALGVAVVIVAVVPLALHAHASGPSNASLPDFSSPNNPPVQQSAPNPWGYEVQTGGLQAGDKVSFKFLYNGQVGDRQHSVNFFDLDPTTTQLQGSMSISTITSAPVGVPVAPPPSEQCVGTGTTYHPSAVEVDPYAQTVTVTIREAHNPGDVLVYCFKPALAGLVGLPTTTTPNDPSSGYSIEYTEPGGSITAPYSVNGQSSASPTSPVLHVLDTAGTDVTDRGLGGSKPLVYGVTYDMTLHGQGAVFYNVNGTAYGAATDIASSDSVIITGTGAPVGTCTPMRGTFCTNASGDATGTITVSSSAAEADYVAISAIVNSPGFTSTAVATLISVTVAPSGFGAPTPGSVPTQTPLPPGSTPSHAPFDPNCANPLFGAKGLGSRDVLDAAQQVLIPDATAVCSQLAGRFSYTGINDDVGIAQALNTVDTDYGFAGLDRSLTTTEYENYTAPGAFGGGVEQFPLFIEPVVVTYNLDAPGCQTSRVNLRSQVLSLIFMGQISTWNNNLIVQDNGGLSGCNLPILIAHDIGITSSIFKDYLSKRNPQWAAYKQPQLADAWPSQSPVSCTANGSRAMALCVAGQPGMIGYGYYRFITQAQLPVAGVDNTSGTSGSATASPGVGFQSAPFDKDTGCSAVAANSPVVPASTNSDWSTASLTDPATGYPICAFDFLVAHTSCARNVVSYQGLRAFLGAVYLDSTQADLAAHGFAPLPTNITSTAQAGFNSGGSNAQPLQC